MSSVNLELTQGQADLLYNSLSALCLQYEQVIEKADTASKKKLYQNYREKTLEIIRQIEKQRVDEAPWITRTEDQQLAWMPAEVDAEWIYRRLNSVTLEELEEEAEPENKDINR